MMCGTYYSYEENTAWIFQHNFTYCNQLFTLVVGSAIEIVLIELIRIYSQVVEA